MGKPVDFLHAFQHTRSDQAHIVLPWYTSFVRPEKQISLKPPSSLVPNVMSSKQFPLALLPSELIAMLANSLNYSSQLALKWTCRRFYAAVPQPLWQQPGRHSYDDLCVIELLLIERWACFSNHHACTECYRILHERHFPRKAILSRRRDMGKAGRVGGHINLELTREDQALQVPPHELVNILSSAWIMVSEMPCTRWPFSMRVPRSDLYSFLKKRDTTRESLYEQSKLLDQLVKSKQSWRRHWCLREAVMDYRIWERKCLECAHTERAFRMDGQKPCFTCRTMQWVVDGGRICASCGALMSANDAGLQDTLTLRP